MKRVGLCPTCHVAFSAPINDPNPNPAAAEVANRDVQSSDMIRFFDTVKRQRLATDAVGFPRRREVYSRKRGTNSGGDRETFKSRTWNTRTRTCVRAAVCLRGSVREEARFDSSSRLFAHTSIAIYTS